MTIFTQNASVTSPVTTTSSTMADKLIVSLHQVFFHQRGRKRKECWSQHMAKHHRSLLGLVAALSCQARCNICKSVSYCPANILKYVWEQFQLLYKAAKLSLHVLKTFWVSCQIFFCNSFSLFSVANLCHGRCQEFRSKHFTSKYFAFSCHLFITHRGRKGLQSWNILVLPKMVRWLTRQDRTK